MKDDFITSCFYLSDVLMFVIGLLIWRRVRNLPWTADNKLLGFIGIFGMTLAAMSLIFAKSLVFPFILPGFLSRWWVYAFALSIGNLLLLPAFGLSYFSYKIDLLKYKYAFYAVWILSLIIYVYYPIWGIQNL